jgi:hypothetical protein
VPELEERVVVCLRGITVRLRVGLRLRLRLGLGCDCQLGQGPGNHCPEAPGAEIYS